MAAQISKADAVRRAVVSVLAVQARRVGTDVWHVPSGTEPGKQYTVRRHGHTLRCSCIAGSWSRACKHADAVRQRLHRQPDAANAEARRAASC